MHNKKAETFQIQLTLYDVVLKQVLSQHDIVRTKHIINTNLNNFIDYNHIFIINSHEMW